MAKILDYPANNNFLTQHKLILQGDPNHNSFHSAMKMPITLMQVFGFLPVQGIRGSSYKSLHFSWMSWKVVYSIASIFGYIFNFVMYWINHPVDNIWEINAIMFHTITIVLSILLVRLAIKWPKFAKEWHSIELVMKSYELPVNLKRKIRFIAVGVVFVAAVEHFMVMGNRLYKRYRENNGDSETAWRIFFTETIFPEVFDSLKYYPWAGIILQFMIVQKSFIWTFIDVFIGSISICLTYKLKQICKKLEYYTKIEVNNIYVWRAIRNDYIKVTILTQSVNRHLSWFIMISYTSNLFYILTQLFSSLRPVEESVQKIYFYISFFLLTLRLTIVCIFGGAVNDQNLDIIRVLQSVPSRIYNIEIERFLTLLATCDMVLTGKNFFRITRNLILKIASAIVTYELVLVQFNTQDFKKPSH